MPVRGVTTNVGRDVSADFCAAPIDVSSSIAVATSKVIDGICLMAMVVEDRIRAHGYCHP
jgi:hypothetical protein